MGALTLVRRPFILSNQSLRFSPAAPTITTTGDELLTNGNMETANPPSSWTAVNSVLSGQADERTGGAGAQCLQVANSGVNYGRAKQFVAVTQNQWYKLTAWQKNGTTTGRVDIETSAAATVARASATSGPSWAEQVVVIGRAPTTSIGPSAVVAGSNADGETARFDDISLKQVSFASMLSDARDAGAKAGVFDRAVTVGTYQQGGFAYCLNDEANPTYCMYAIVDRNTNKAYLLKVDNGTATELTSGNITYVAGSLLRVRASGSTHTLFYNGAPVGTAQSNDTGNNYGMKVAGIQTSDTDTVGTIEVNV